VSLLLHIDTAAEKAYVCVSEDENILAEKTNTSQKDHAAWLHTAIKEICTKTNVNLQQLDSVAVSSGPGSYTGLRVAFATAKGLCYALNIPLIAVNTLQIMALAASQSLLKITDSKESINQSTALLCPMIDARRMEVFTAVFTPDLTEVLTAQNLILHADSFSDILQLQKVVFSGNGSIKFQSLLKHFNAIFLDVNVEAQHLVKLAYNEWLKGKFQDLAYSEPFYGKEFYSPAHKLPPV
jgi:tRNA threonylcarbamoyladenosine biosynthesis protein TsaB